MMMMMMMMMVMMMMAEQSPQINYCREALQDNPRQSIIYLRRS